MSGCYCFEVFYLRLLTMNCQNCGESNDLRQNYCRNCGAPLAQTQPYQAPRQADKPPRIHGWASPSSPLHDLNATPRQVEPLEPPMPAPIAPVAPSFAERAAQPNQTGFRCPRCNSTAAPVIKSKMSDAGLVTLILLLFLCLPIFWVGFLMREKYSVCPACLLRMD